MPISFRANKAMKAVAFWSLHFQVGCQTEVLAKIPVVSEKSAKIQYFKGFFRENAGICKSGYKKKRLCQTK